jgi:hypothetical protein
VNNDPGKCVASSACPALKKLRQENYAEYRRILNGSKCEKTGNIQFFCCADEPPKWKNEIRKKVFSAPNCGVDATSRVHGRTKAKFGTFVSMALLQFSNDDQTGYFQCGGALINQKFVITGSFHIS